MRERDRISGAQRRLLVAAGAAALTIGAATAQLSPGPVWRQFPPIGGFWPQHLHVDAAGALVVVGGNAESVRMWRLDASWVEVVVEPVPTGHGSAAFAYDKARDVLVLFGATANGLGFPGAQTWEFDGTAWTEVVVAVKPSPRFRPSLAYDEARGRCVLYGGWDGQSTLDDTWEFDGTTWQPMTPPIRPSLAAGAMMTFDANLQQVLLVGPPAGAPATPPCETWRFDGQVWHRLLTTASPGPHVSGRIAFDPSQARTVVFGGHPVPLTAGYSPAAWAFDGTDWTPIGNAPAPYLGGGMTHWPATGGLTIVGGRGPVGSVTGAIHTLTPAGTWSQLTADPLFDRGDASVAYDSARDCLVLHGGRDPAGNWLLDTWEWRASNGWSSTSSGTGPQASLAYDARRAVCVAVDAGITWQYDNGAWTSQQLNPSPVDGAVYYDRHLQRVRLVDGSAFWTFDGSAWNATPAPPLPTGSAPRRAVHWASEDDVCVRDANGDDWQFDGATWVAQTHPYPSGAPGDLVEDSRRGLVVFLADDPFGAPATVARGKNYTTVWPHRTDTTGWSLQFCADVVRGDVYGVTRLGHVFRLDWLDTPSTARLGRGCAGSAGVPSLSPLTTSAPTLGQPLPLTLSAAPLGGTAGLLVLGDAFAPISGLPLPVALDAIGLPGCDAWTSLVVSYPFSTQGPVALVQVPLPSDRAIAGRAIGAQALLLDPWSATAWGSVSNAVVVVAH